MGCKSGDNESENGFNFKINAAIELRIALCMALLRKTQTRMMRSSLIRNKGEPFRKTNVSASNPLTVFGDIFEELYSILKEMNILSPKSASPH